MVLSISVGSPELSAQLGSNDTQGEDTRVNDLEWRGLVSPPVSISFRASDGRKIPMASLAKPIDIRLPATSAEAICAFWDEAEATWSTRGLVRLTYGSGGNGPELLCQTTHLTLFGALVNKLAQVVKCSTAVQILSPKGFEKLGKGDWFLTTPSIVACSAAQLAARRLFQLCSSKKMH